MPGFNFDDPVMPAPGNSGTVQLNDLTTLDVRAVYNKSIYAFLAQWLIFTMDWDQQIFSPADSDMILALKNTVLMMGIDITAAQVRQMFPQLIL